MQTPYRLVLCASLKYATYYGTPLTPQELQQHKCLTYLYDAWHFSGSFQEWHIRDSLGEEHTVKLKSWLQMNNGLALRQAAIDGLGIALLPQVLIEQDLTNGRLLQLMEEYQFPERPLYLLHLPDYRGSPRLRSFIEFMLMYFGQNECIL